MYNILLTNVGRRGKLVQNFKKSLGSSCKIIATDNWSVAPALFMADNYYITKKVSDSDYIYEVMNICLNENINAITTLIDTEISILSANREKFIEKGILPLCPDEKTANLCFDKFAMYKYLTKCNIPTVLTYDSIESFIKAKNAGDIEFPVFIKPRTGSGSVGAQKINTLSELKTVVNEGDFDYIIQEFMDCEDFDADVYVDTITNEAVSIFSKRKIETRIGGASKTISFKDENLFKFIEQIVKLFKFYGPIDMDFFFKEGKYFLSEINPRFGGAYLNAFGAGIDFPKMIANNIDGKINKKQIGNYDEGVLMLMYDDVIITTLNDLKKNYND